VIGIKDPVIDSLIDTLIRVESREQQLAACRALDRVLLWGDYVIPQWYISVHRVAYRDRFGMPPVVPSYGDYGFYHWWIKP
jgi:microcin C transport system substrate-binding protein